MWASHQRKQFWWLIIWYRNKWSTFKQNVFIQFNCQYTDSLRKINRTQGHPLRWSCIFKVSNSPLLLHWSCWSAQTDDRTVNMHTDCCPLITWYSAKYWLLRPGSYWPMHSTSSSAQSSTRAWKIQRECILRWLPIALNAFVPNWLSHPSS